MKEWLSQNKKYVWIGIAVMFVIGIFSNQTNQDQSQTTDTPPSAQTNATTTTPTETDTSTEAETIIKDYSLEDAKNAYNELTTNGYSVILKQNGHENVDMHDTILFFFNDSTDPADPYVYADNPYIVVRQEIEKNTVTLYVDLQSSINQRNEQKKMQTQMDDVSALSACEQYGKRMYRNFKIHSILGKIANQPLDGNTWVVKYTVDVDGYKDLTMECYVTGTSASPVVDPERFAIY